MYAGAMPEVEPKTRLSVLFQYKGPASSRPLDQTQEEDFNFEIPCNVPPPALFIPDVGDAVILTSLTSGEGRAAYKVLSRTFSYQESPLGLYVYVNIVVTDIDDDEMNARLKQ